MLKDVTNEGMQMNIFKQKVEIDQALLKQAVNDALVKIDQNIDTFGTKFPESATVNHVYALNRSFANPGVEKQADPGSNTGWTTSFWTGMLWLAYEQTEDKKYLEILNDHIKSFLARAENRLDTNTHDLGFLYTLSSVSSYKLTNNEDAKVAALKAADLLMERYVESAGIIQAWGDMNDPNQRGRMIIDCLMNLPLLYWASEVTGNKLYQESAYRHAQNAYKYIVREDATTYHTYFFDTETGAPRFGKTFQGYSDDSCWARGQAWGIYGFILSYLYTKDEKFLEMSKKLANYFLNRLPEDLVAYWDLIFSDGSGEERDSSASAIAVCGLLELAKHLQNRNEKDYYKNAAYLILKSLYENYSTKDDNRSNALILHGVYSKPANYGVDEANLWGDYFYLEALTRMTKDWELYW